MVVLLTLTNNIYKCDIPNFDNYRNLCEYFYNNIKSDNVYNIVLENTIIYCNLFHIRFICLEYIEFIQEESLKKVDITKITELTIVFTSFNKTNRSLLHAQFIEDSLLNNVFYYIDFLNSNRNRPIENIINIVPIIRTDRLYIKILVYTEVFYDKYSIFDYLDKSILTEEFIIELVKIHKFIINNYNCNKYITKKIMNRLIDDFIYIPIRDVSQNLLKDKTIAFKLLLKELSAYNNTCINFNIYGDNRRRVKEKIINYIQYNEKINDLLAIVSIIPDELKYHNKKIVLLILDYLPKYYMFISEELKNDNDVIKKVIEKKPSYIQYIPEKKLTYINVMTAIKLNGCVLQYLPNKYKNNYSINLEAVKNNGTAVKYSTYKKNFNIALTAVSNNGRAIMYLKNFRANEKIMLTAVTSYGVALKYATKKLQNNYDIVFNAVNQCGVALNYASDRLKCNEEIIIAGVKNNRHTIEYVPKDLINNIEFIKKLENVNRDILSVLYNNINRIENKEIINRVLIYRDNIKIMIRLQQDDYYNDYANDFF